jgi:hypothetical protein
LVGLASFIAMLLWIQVGIKPILGASDPDSYGRYLADSSRYLAESKEFDFTDLSSYVPPVDEGVTQLAQGGTNVILYIQGHLATNISPESPHLTIFLMNVVVLTITFSLIFSTASELKFHLSKTATALIVANPGAWISTLTLTKEIWGLLFVAAILFLVIRYKWFTVAIVTAASFWVRGYYVAIGLTFLASNRISWWKLTIAISILLGIVETAFVPELTQFRIERSRDLGQRTGDLMHTLGLMQSYPLGHLIAGPIVLVINIVSPAINPAQYRHGFSALYVVGMSASSIYSILLSFLLIWHYRLNFRTKTLPINWEQLRTPVVLIIIFAFYVALFPISQHRFLIPVTPVFALLALSHPRSGNGSSPKEQT